MTLPFAKYADSPFLISQEGETITVKLVKTSPTAGTITWTKPSKPSGCDPTLPLGYNGCIITLDQSPVDPSKFPKNGKIYNADPSANPDMNIGDRIGSSLVVGALYDDTSTFTIDVYDLEPSKPYYVTLHAVDAQLRYHVSGVHTYSLDFGNTPQLGTPGFQIVKLGQDTSGVSLADITGLSSKIYELPIFINFKRYTMEINGALSATYGDLIDHLNKQAYLLENPLESILPPNTNALYFNETELSLYKWNGIEHQRIESLYVSDYDPSSIGEGTYSYNQLQKLVYVFESGNWIPLLTYHTPFAPNDVKCKFVWFDGLSAYKWVGVWDERSTVMSQTDPSTVRKFDCTTYWYNADDLTLNRWTVGCSGWKQISAIVMDRDPSLPNVSDLWLDEKTLIVNEFDGNSWIQIATAKADKQMTLNGEYYFDQDEGMLYVNNGSSFQFVDAIVWIQDPTNLKTGTLWWDDSTQTVKMWEKRTNSWILQPLYVSSSDPRYPSFDIGTIWIQDNNAYEWDGGKFHGVELVTSPQPINEYQDGLAWVSSGTLKVLQSGSWVTTQYVNYSEMIFNINDGDYWFNPNTRQMHQYASGTFAEIAVSFKPLKPQIGFTYYNINMEKLQKWSGAGWVDGDPLITFKLNDSGHLLIQTTAVGSGSAVKVEYFESGPDGVYTSGTISELFADLTYPGEPMRTVEGSDPQSSVPSYMELGVGTDGSDDERREMIDSIRFQLGYPQVEVELTKVQMNAAITNAIEVLRQRTGTPYSRMFMFMDIVPGQQNYKLTNRRLEHHKIVDVLKMYRVRSSFMSMAHGQGVHGQMALQQMYTMGSFDLVSFHLVGQYIETMNELFAADIQFKFKESDRTLTIFKHFNRPERVLVQVNVERTEQELFKDRQLRQWIQNYAKAQCRLMLAEIRGKFSSLPGAGGGVQLNAADQSSRADMEIAMLLQEIDDYIVNNPEDYSSSIMFFG